MRNKKAMPKDMPKTDQYWKPVHTLKPKIK